MNPLLHNKQYHNKHLQIDKGLDVYKRQFQKFASELMIINYGINENVAGTFAGLPALGALILTPIFGGFIDKRGKSASAPEQALP